MDEYLSLDDGNPSLETVRRWAYDNHLCLIDQDEDLVLHDVRYTRLLLQLAREPACPKNDYCLSIVYYHSQLRLLARDEQACAAISACIDGDVEASPVTKRWAEQFRNAHGRFVKPRPMSYGEAESLAHWLLVGDYCKRSFSRTGRVVDQYHEFECHTESYIGFLYLNFETGLWRQASYRPLSRIDG